MKKSKRKTYEVWKDPKKSKPWRVQFIYGAVGYETEEEARRVAKVFKKNT